MGFINVVPPTGLIQRIPASKPPTLAQMQEWVGGYIEVVHPRGAFNGKQVQMIVNEEGLLKQLPVNPHASRLYGGVIVGTVVILEGLRLS